MQIQGQYRYEVQYEVKTRSERGQIHAHKTGEPTSIKYQPSIIISYIQPATQPASQQPASQASQPAKPSQPARRPASQPPARHQPISQPPSQASQPSQPSQSKRSTACKQDMGVEYEVRPSKTIRDWRTR